MIGRRENVREHRPDALQDRVVLLTGASGGIGQATAVRLAAAGAVVVCAGRDQAVLDDLAGRIGGVACAGDERDPGRAQQLVDVAMQQRGRLDAVIANAGVGHQGDFAEMPPARIAELIEVNLLAPLLLARAAFEPLGAQRGALLFVGSIAGLLGVSDEAVYSATKAALSMFAESVGREARAAGVSLGLLAPGVVDTEFFIRRGEPYRRAHPRPISAEQVAVRIESMLINRQAVGIEPRWLAGPARIRGLAPRIYRRLSDRFG